MFVTGRMLCERVQAKAGRIQKITNDDVPELHLLWREEVIQPSLSQLFKGEQCLMEVDNLTPQTLVQLGIAISERRFEELFRFRRSQFGVTRGVPLA